MKTLLVIHVVFVILAFTKLEIVKLKIKREYVLPKSNVSIFEKLLRKTYYTIIYCIPPFALWSLFVSEDSIVRTVTKDMVKKDA